MYFEFVLQFVEHMQGRHGRFLADKAAIMAATSPAHRHALPLPLSNSQNLAKDQALVALPPVAALICTPF